MILLFPWDEDRRAGNEVCCSLGSPSVGYIHADLYFYVPGSEEKKILASRSVTAIHCPLFLYQHIQYLFILESRANHDLHPHTPLGVFFRTGPNHSAHSQSIAYAKLNFYNVHKWQIINLSLIIVLVSKAMTLLMARDIPCTMPDIFSLI